MNVTKNGLVALGMIAALSAVDLTAQEDVRPERGPAFGGPNVERIMSMRERLELTDDQIAALDEIRADEVERRAAMRAEMDELRSRLRAGQVRRSEVMAFMEDRRDAREAEVTALRERIESVLEPAQLEQLEQIRAEARAFQRGRRSARAGMRDGRGFERGQRPGLRRAPRGGERPGPRAGQPGNDRSIGPA